MVNQAIVWLDGDMRGAEQDRERRDLKDAVRRLLSRSSDTRAAMESPDGFDRSLWTRLCTEVGVAGLAVPEEHGGNRPALREGRALPRGLRPSPTPAPRPGAARAAPPARPP